MSSTVALVRGQERYANVAAALSLVAGQVNLAGCRRVVIKPNFVSTHRQLASTHVDATQAVLDFVRARYDGPLVIAEGSALASTWEGFDHFGFRQMASAYELKLIDLNADETVLVQVYDRHLRPRTLRLARTIVDSDFRISVGPPKTHDTVIVTLSFKNMIMGSLVNRRVAHNNNGHHSNSRAGLVQVIPRPVRESWTVQRLKARLGLGERSDKMAMHQGYPVINLNLAMLAAWVRPHLAIIDGFQAMEGAGPIDGDPVEWRVALAGTDALAVDGLCARLMGFDPTGVGYLDYCRQLGLGCLEPGEVLGNVTLAEVQRRFRPHPTYASQQQWRLPDVEQWLRPAAPVEPRLVADRL
ncbi:MAG: DUF362 domain-containing protein [Chloroflexi bacterium]|nr:DUF362 domain-containing protein [Chloroflexota bacterium]MCI0576595.1 DUF362 domain-containing protein [Chloroflexota bacterium]MCI0647037.1 DUF362 domain-containing protein [Chloroflexota bacterium]MCI0730737.1 DUF362 domain-containing protein [Chloroflexota bacterium]